MAASRAERVCVARGSIPYSEVIQPLPRPRIHSGTRSSRLAEQSTWVFPSRTRQEPSAWSWTPVSSFNGLDSSGILIALDSRLDLFHPKFVPAPFKGGFQEGFEVVFSLKRIRQPLAESDGVCVVVHPGQPGVLR